MLLALFSLQTQAETYQYNAKVKGMVCAFCAYSVSKNISQLAGVDSDTVNVDLKGGHVSFISKQKVNENKLSSLFSDSGFSISQLTFTKINKSLAVKQKEVSLDLTIDVFKVDQFSGVFESIGNMVANTSAKIIIHAPADQEESILKPLLMGRQQVIKLEFIASDKAKINLQILN